MSSTPSPSIIGTRELARRRRDLRHWVGRQIREARIDAGVRPGELAACAGITRGYLWKIEAGEARPSLDILAGLGGCLGSELSVRLFPGAGPRLRDRFQAPMIEGLLRLIHPNWKSRPEVPVPAARGVIDLVLTRGSDRCTVACECHSELRRLELALRRASEKAEALGPQFEGGPAPSRLLLLRSTEATRDLARAYEATLAASFPARTTEAIAALRTDAPWPGPAIVWARVAAGRAEILDGPPRGVRVGR